MFLNKIISRHIINALWTFSLWKIRTLFALLFQQQTRQALNIETRKPMSISRFAVAPNGRLTEFWI